MKSLGAAWRRLFSGASGTSAASGDSTAHADSVSELPSTKARGQVAQDMQQSLMDGAMRESDPYPLQAGPGYVCFWNNDETDEYCASADEAHFTFAFIHDKLAEIFAVPGSFIGVSDRHGNTIQFEVRAGLEVWLDIPLVDKGGSMRKLSCLSEAQALVALQADDLGSLEISGLEFETWK